MQPEVKTMSDQTPTINSALTIRRLDLTDADRAALARLAARDSGDILDGPVIGVEVEGRLLAARSLSTGRVLADPFSHTEELRTLLELRAAHLRRREASGVHGVRVHGRSARVARLVGL